MECSALWSSPLQKSMRLRGATGAPIWAATCSMRLVMPCSLAAEMGTTGTRSSRASSSVSTVTPLAAASSIMLRATTMGMLSSSSCRLR